MTRILKPRMLPVAYAALAFASVTHGLGQAIVQNHCSFPTYLWSVSNTVGPEQTLQPGDTYSEIFQINPAGGGISIKVSDDSNLSGNIAQFEYTLVDLLYYDISLINGSPFSQYGVTLIPASSSCPSVRCTPEGGCGEGNVFYQPGDVSAIGACNPVANLVFTLCSGGDGGQTNIMNPGSQPQPATTTAMSPPTPTPAPSYPAPPASTPTPSYESPPCSTSTSAAPPTISIPPGEPVYTTFQTYYTTVDTTTDDIITVTAR